MNPVNAPEHVRDIDTGMLPTRFARGWHCLGLADTYRDGKPHAVEAFGTKPLVLAVGPLRPGSADTQLASSVVDYVLANQA